MKHNRQQYPLHQDYFFAFTTKNDFYSSEHSKNIKKYLDNHKVRVNSLWTAHQIHSNQVSKVENSHEGIKVAENCDALITNESLCCLAVRTADCVPILLYDSVNSAVAAIHSGWKGTGQNILKETVIAMHHHYTTDSSQLTLLLGPHIGSCCYEVQEDVTEKFAPYQEGVKQKQGKAFLDLENIILSQAKDLGITNISKHNPCTACEYQSYYSYRRDKELLGSQYAIIILR